MHNYVNKFPNAHYYYYYLFIIIFLIVFFGEFQSLNL